MKKLFEIDENEKRRILEMHENATRKNYLSEQGTPPSAASPASEGTMINGKRYTIENIKDETSLNQFLQWGLGPEDKTSPFGENSSKAAPTLNRARFAGVTDLPASEDELRDGGKTDVAKAAIEKINSMYPALDLIAQNYTISELCSVESPVKPGINPKALEIARVRVKSVLGWCGKTQTQLDREAKKAAQNKTQLDTERGKF